MPVLHPIQTSFAAGELSPLMLGRVDTEGYREGLLTLENMLPDPRGPAYRRSSSTHITRLEGNDARLIPFRVAGGTFFNVALTHQLGSILGVTGAVPSENFILNPSFISGGTHWIAEPGLGDIIFAGGECRLTTAGSNNQETYIEQEVTVLVGTDDHIIDLSLYSPEIPVRVTIGTTQGDDDILSAIAPASGKQIFSPGVDTFWVRFVVDSSDGTNETARLFSAFIYDTEDLPLDFTTPYDEADLQDIQFVQAPGTQALYLFHRDYPPHKFFYDPDSEAWGFAEVDWTPAVPPWQEEGEFYPGCGTVFQGRLWVGGTHADPETFWGSVSGSFEDFTLGTEADDAMAFTLERFGEICWMEGTKNLLIGTVNSEYIVTSDGPIITPGDLQAMRQSAYGSARIQPEQVGDQVLYVSEDQATVRAMQYEWAADNWLSKDMTFISEHVARAGIRRLGWAQNPYNVLWCTLRDGNMASLTYERSHDIYGWARHVTPDARFVDTAVGVLGGRSLPVLAAQIEPGFIDIMIQAPAEDNYPFGMEGALRQTNLTPLFYADGFVHLEGFTVNVTADGAVHPQREVGAESIPGAADGVVGRIYLQYPAEEVVAGLPVTAVMETLPFDALGQQGSLAEFYKRWSSIYLRMFGSGRPLINGQRPPDRTPSTPMNTREPDRTEDIFVTELGWSLPTVNRVEQDLPVALTVLAVYGKLTAESL